MDEKIFSLGVSQGSFGGAIKYLLGLGPMDKFVEETEEAAVAEAKKHYGETVILKRDEDVLDTWFSSLFGLSLHWDGLIRLKS